MAIGNNDCYGEKKNEIVKRYFLAPIAHIKMLPHMVKDGCCGQLTEQFYIFSYTSMKDRNDRGTFFVGADCAKQMIDMVNAVKERAGKPPLEVPQMFDISVDSGFLGGYHKKIKVLNFDVLTLLLLLSASWNVQQFYGAPANILERIVRNPLKTIGRRDLLKIDELIAKVDLFATIKGHEKDGAKIGKFSINHFNTVLDFIKTEESDLAEKARRVGGQNGSKN